MYNQVSTQLPGVLVGEVAGADDQGRPLVFTELHGARAADVVWMPEPPSWSTCVGLRVVIGHVDGDERRPIILGLLDAPPTTRTKEKAPDTLRVESNKELVIECGKSKIAMRADGRIEIRGGHLISRSSGPNKIKGGSVHIN